MERSFNKRILIHLCKVSFFTFSGAWKTGLRLDVHGSISTLTHLAEMEIENLIVHKFATLGEFLACRLSLHRHNTKRCGQHVKKFEGVIVEMQKFCNTQAHDKLVSIQLSEVKISCIYYTLQNLLNVQTSRMTIQLHLHNKTIDAELT